MNTIARIAALIAAGLSIAGLICLGGDLVISEIAWAGTAASSADEWIELQNPGQVAIDLTGWQLVFGDTVVPLGEASEDAVEIRTTVLEPGGFLVLERTDDDSISDIAADVLYKGALSNTGISIELRNPEGAVVDSVILEEAAGWPAGSAGDGEPPYCTMERTNLGEWTTCNGIVRNGLDANGDAINGTPGQPNSADILAQWAPSVQLVFPAEEGSVLSGIEWISWVASDPDGADSALAIAILVSPNEDEGWNVLIDNLANTGSFSWDTAAHPSGDGYRLLIRALDPEGFIGEVASPAFEILNGSN
jgi:hypothetical protein